MSAAYEPIPLLDFIPALSPRLGKPEHLAPVAELFERARHHERVEGFATTPPQHGKTELVKHGIVHRLLDDPTTRIGYGSYAGRRSHKISREIRRLFQRAGGQLDAKAGAAADWRTGHEGGGVWAAGVDGSWTGEGFDLVVIDDPIKGRKEAESALERQNLWDWFKDDLTTRMAPNGSIIVIHTRWHVEDLGGRLVTEEGYEHVRLPAIDAHGRPLWGWRYSIEELRRREAKLGPYAWQSLYMGRPFARGGQVFDTSEEWVRAHTYDVRPTRLRIAIGTDLAYSKKTSADWSVIVVLGFDDLTERIYVLNVIRRQMRAPAFAELLKATLAEHPGVEARWYHGGGGELGVADFIEQLDVDLEALPATSDKGIRALPVAAAWNGVPEKNIPGRVFLPRSAPWLDDFLTEVGAFTGVVDLADDQVDGLAAAFDSGESPSWVSAMEKMRRLGVRG